MRDSELLLFDQVYRAAKRGQGAVLLVCGPVGTGKTALLQAMVARARRECGWCFVVTGSARERAHPFGVVDRLIRSMCAAGMEEPFPGGLDGGNLFAMIDRVFIALRDFAGSRPVVIGIDDVHFSDEQSLRCLSYLIRRIESFGVVMVLNESSSYERDMAELRAEMLHLPFCHRVRLAPLTADDITELWKERFGTRPGCAAARFCAETSGGIPLLLHALIDDQAAAPGPAACEPGVNYRQAVLRSLHRCAPSTAAVAQAMAVLGDRGAPDLIAQLAGVDAALGEESGRDLHDMGLLGSEGFRSPHTRAAVLAGIPLPNLPGMHSRAAELLHESGAPAIAVAEHLIAAQDGGKAPWRVAILFEAAREAMAAGDVESAVSSLRHAVGASADEAQRARAGVLLADAQWHADPSRAVRRLDEVGRDARAGLVTGPDLQIAVNQLFWWGEFAEADELLGLRDGDSGLARLWAYFGKVGTAPEPCEEFGRRIGPIAAATYLSAAMSRTFDRVRTDWADRMLLGVRAGSPFMPALYVLVVLVRTGRLDEAAAWCDRLLKEDWVNRVPMRKALIELVRAVAAVRDGDNATALSRIRDVFEAVPPPAWGVVVGLPLAIAIRAGADLGDVPSARAYLAVAVPPAMLDTPFALPYLQALGRYHLAVGRPESAATYSRSGAELMTEWGVDPEAAEAVLAGFDVPRPPPAAVASPDPGTSDDRSAVGEPDPLTHAERRVADLAAAGNTNRQIAEHLFITVSTVEQHLTKIYRKLNVRSRSGLRRYCH